MDVDEDDDHGACFSDNITIIIPELWVGGCGGGGWTTSDNEGGGDDTALKLASQQCVCVPS